MGVLGLHWIVPDAVALLVYGLLILGYVVTKMLLARKYQRLMAAVERKSVSDRGIDVAIAFYNEDPGLVEACVASALGQQGISLGAVVVVDDGSPSRHTFDHLAEAFRDDPRVICIREDVNKGKRYALAIAFSRLRSEFAAVLDSDSVLDAGALASMVSLMTSGSVSAVTANIRALNRNDNWLSRAIDGRYRNAFMVERAAQSVLGSVLCASGVLSVYRSDFLRDISEEWASQTFAGRPVQFGDDRRLTSLALRRGRTIIDLRAAAATQVPTEPIPFFKQQLRWNKSFLRESILAIKEFGVASAPGLLSFLDLLFWLLYLSFIACIFFKPVIGFGGLGLIWLSFVVLAAIFRNGTTVKSLLIAPVYSMAHVLILTPLRLAALLTILDTRWGTR